MSTTVDATDGAVVWYHHDRPEDAIHAGESCLWTVDGQTHAGRLLEATSDGAHVVDTEGNASTVPLTAIQRPVLPQVCHACGYTYRRYACDNPTCYANPASRWTKEDWEAARILREREVEERQERLRMLQLSLTQR